MPIIQVLDQNTDLIQIARMFLMKEIVESKPESIFLTKDHAFDNDIKTSTNVGQVRELEGIQKPISVQSILNENWVSEGTNVAVWCQVKLKGVRRRIFTGYKFNILDKKVKQIDVFIYSADSFPYLLNF